MFLTLNYLDFYKLNHFHFLAALPLGDFERSGSVLEFLPEFVLGFLF